jgi:GT2 family glycosyltransferase
MLISAVVVNHQGRDLLRPCLESVEQALRRVDGDTELIVVDNGSSDGSRELVRDAFPSAKLVPLPGNEGFSGGVVRGIAKAHGRWVALLNNDATIAPDGLVEMLAAGEADARIGSVAPQIRFADRPGVVNSAGLELDCLGIAADRLVGSAVDALQDRQPEDIFGATGGAALLRRIMLDETGGFDESFFAFFEDVDLAWRARALGWRAVYTPRAVVHHHHSATARHGSPAKLYLVGRNRVRALAKNATTGLLIRHGLRMALYDALYVGYVLVSARTLAPLRGRLRGLREWRLYRRSGRPYRGPVELTRPLGLAKARRRHEVWVAADAGRQARRAI